MEDEIIKHLGSCVSKKCNCSPLNDAFIRLNSKEVFIIDEKDHEPIKTVQKEGLNQIKVTNESKEKFTIVKIDNCIICNNSEPKCDGVIYNQKLFYFLEIKAPKRKGKSQAKTKAYIQLEAMIGKFKDINFNKREIHAVIGFPMPRTPIVGTRSNTQKSRFKDDFKIKYGISVNLMEGHEIVLG